MKELFTALVKLEVITTKQITEDRIAVYIAGEYFGIWDTKKKTFVD